MRVADFSPSSSYENFHPLSGGSGLDLRHWLRPNGAATATTAGAAAETMDCATATVDHAATANDSTAATGNCAAAAIESTAAAVDHAAAANGSAPAAMDHAATANDSATTASAVAAANESTGRAVSIHHRAAAVPGKDAKLEDGR